LPSARTSLKASSLVVSFALKTSIHALSTSSNTIDFLVPYDASLVFTIILLLSFTTEEIVIPSYN
jgi:hypothetical protein